MKGYSNHSVCVYVSVCFYHLISEPTRFRYLDNLLMDGNMQEMQIFFSNKCMVVKILQFKSFVVVLHLKLLTSTIN